MTKHTVPRIFFVFLVICILIVAKLLLFPSHTADRFYAYKRSAVILEGKTYTVLVAENFDQQYQGLSDITDKKTLDGASGMVFVFAKADIQSFVNRRTYLPLKIYWMQDDRVVGTDFLPSLTQNNNTEVVVTSPKSVDKVVEIIE